MRIRVSDWDPEVAIPDGRFGRVLFKTRLHALAFVAGLTLAYFFAPWMALLVVAYVAAKPLDLRPFGSRLDQQARDQLFEQYSDLPEIEEHPVEIHLYYEETKYGTDTGVLCVVDGWLHFTGLTSSFSIARQHAERAYKFRQGQGRNWDGYIPTELPFRVHYTADAPRYAIAYRLLEEKNESHQSLVFQRWVSSQVEHDGALPQSVFPPNLPSRISMGPIWRLTVISLAYWVAGVAILVSQGLHSTLVVAAPFALICFLLARRAGRKAGSDTLNLRLMTARARSGSVERSALYSWARREVESKELTG